MANARTPTQVGGGRLGAGSQSQLVPGSQKPAAVSRIGGGTSGIGGGTTGIGGGQRRGTLNKKEELKAK